MENKKSFNLMALLFGAYYYVGYGKTLKGFILGVISTFPLFGILTNIYLGFKANSELNIKENSFKWLNVIALFIVQLIVVIPLYYSLPNGQKELLLEDVSGTWKTRMNEVIVIDLVSSKKSITIQNNKLQVILKNIDLDNKIIDIKLDENLSWQLAQKYNSNDSFTIVIKASNGSIEELYYMGD